MQKYSTIFRYFLILVCVVFVGLCAQDAFASSGGGGSNLPFVTPLENLKEAIAGPVAKVISLIGIVAAGATLIFGGDMNGFLRTLILIVGLVSIIMLASSFLTSIGGEGAVITLEAIG